ncbi:unnamed protein product, partial [Hapterophycus canaliculatus]
VAIKILNPVGFRLAPAATLRRCVVARRGQPVGGGSPHKLGPEHVWWLVSPNTKQVLAAYIHPRYGSLVELPLPKCIEIWGLN